MSNINDDINIYIDVQKQNAHGWCILLTCNGKQKILKGAFKDLTDQMVWFKVINIALKSLKNTSGKKIRIFLTDGYNVIKNPKIKTKDSVELEKLKEKLLITFCKFYKTNKLYNTVNKTALESTKMLNGSKLTETSNVDIDRKIATQIANSLSYLLNCDEKILTLIRNKNEKMYSELIEKLIRIGKK